MAACGTVPKATATLTILPTHTATVTARPPTPTVTPSPRPPTATATDTPTPAPTQPPHGTPDDATWQELQNLDYRIVTSAMTRGPEGYLYRAYLLTNPAYKSMMMADLGEPGGTESGPGICTLLFYRWEGDRYTLVQSVGEREAPVVCSAYDWSGWGSPSDRVALGLRGYWSDINANGLPEFAVYKWWCLLCHWWELGNIDFYEIQTAHQVANVAADINGAIVPGIILHTADPLTIWVYDPWYANFETVMVYSVYEWQSNQYVNVSTQYGSEYQAQLEAVVAEIKASGGSTSPVGPQHSVLEILVLTERGGLDRRMGLEAFLDVTELDNYPDATPEERCWLQLARAHAQIDFENGVPFEPYFFADISIAGWQPLSEQYPHLTQDIDTARFDVSACLEE